MSRERISIQVKTKKAQSSGWKRAAPHWPVPGCRVRTSVGDGDLPGQVWVFVDLPSDPEMRPGYYVVPAWYAENDFYERHRVYCETHADQDSFRSIAPTDIEQWRDRWDILGVCARDAASRATRRRADVVEDQVE